MSKPRLVLLVSALLATANASAAVAATEAPTTGSPGRPGATTTAATSTLAGVRIGETADALGRAHPEAKLRWVRHGTLFTWNRDEGVVNVWLYIPGVAQIDFRADESRDDSIDLPCIGELRVHDSHVNLTFALEQTKCGSVGGGTKYEELADKSVVISYELSDGSGVAVTFEGPHDGPLREVVWYQRGISKVPFANAPDFSAYWAASARNVGDLIDHLLPALKYVGGTARVYYAARCPAGDYDSPGDNAGLTFTAVKLRLPAPGATGVAAVRQIFRNDPRVMVTQDQSGMLRIMIGSVSTVILQTKLRHLTLSADEQYSPLLGIHAILNAPEVVGAEHTLDIHRPARIMDILSSRPINGAPHLPTRMQNVTLDDALDAVARTFKGLVLYGFCRQSDGKRWFDLDYTDGS